MRIGLRYLGKLWIQTSRGVRNPTWDMGESSRVECITWVSCEMITVKWPLFWDLPVPTLECGFQGFLLESHEQKLLTEHHLNQMPQNCKMKPLGTHPETKPSNSPLRSSSFIYFFGFHLYQDNKTTLFFLLLGTSLFSHQGLPFCGGSTHPKDLPQSPQNRSNYISTRTALSLSKESSSPIVLLPIYGKFGLGAPFTDIKFTVKL